MNLLRIRPAIGEDVPRMKDLGAGGWESAYSHFLTPENRRAYLDGPFWSIERLLDVVNCSTAVNYAAEIDEHVVGFINVEPLHDDRYEVTRLYVDTSSRGTGIGSTLLHHAFDDLKRRGVEVIIVNVFGDNLAGRRFYERHGFTLTEDTVTTVGDQVVSDVWYARRF